MNGVMDLIFTILSLFSLIEVGGASYCTYYSYYYSGYRYRRCAYGCCGYYYTTTCCDEDTSAGLIAGIVIGCIAFIAIFVVICICIKKKQMANRSTMGTRTAVVHPPQNMAYSHPAGYSSQPPPPGYGAPPTGYGAPPPPAGFSTQPMGFQPSNPAYPPPPAKY